MKSKKQADDTSISASDPPRRDSKKNGNKRVASAPRAAQSCSKDSDSGSSSAGLSISTCFTPSGYLGWLLLLDFILAHFLRFRLCFLLSLTTAIGNLPFAFSGTVFGHL